MFRTLFLSAFLSAFVLAVSMLPACGPETKREPGGARPSATRKAAAAAADEKPGVIRSPRYALEDARIGARGAPAREPDYVTVQHILIGFAGSGGQATCTRTRDEARALAEELLRRARAGEDFDALVKRYTDGAYPGICRMANHDAAPKPGCAPRALRVPALGNVGFRLPAGGIGLAPPDPKTSPHGWRVIKRLE